jgi:galactokinase
VDENEFYANIKKIRAQCGDRAVLRAMHFFDENKRVDAMVQALKAGKIENFLDAVDASGRSSLDLLQNYYAPSHPEAQGLTLALALSRRFGKIHGCRVVSRVHGGGFAGTVQTYVPLEQFPYYKSDMEEIFSGVTELKIRPLGTGELKV